MNNIDITGGIFETQTLSAIVLNNLLRLKKMESFFFYIIFSSIQAEGSKC